MANDIKLSNKKPNTMSRPSGYYFVKVGGEDKILNFKDGIWHESDNVIYGAPLPPMHPTPITPAAIQDLEEILKLYRNTDISLLAFYTMVGDILQKHNLLTDK